jgi:hypothetical protein
MSAAGLARDLHAARFRRTLGIVPVRLDSDTYRIDAVDSLSSGAVRVPAVLSRAGVFSYARADGSLVREWRPEEEVFAAESMASVEDAPVTVGHPAGGVRSDNWREVVAGHVSAKSTTRDDSVAGIRTGIVVSRKDAVERVRDKARTDRLRDLSPGYDVRIDETPGIVPAGHADAGKAYDRVQRDIRYNHIALLAPGGGRQGAAVSLRLDAADNVIEDERADEFPPAKDETPPGKPAKEAKSKDGEPMTDEEKKAQAESEAKLKAETDKEKARADAAESELAKYRAAETAAKRAALESSARGVLGAEQKFDGLNDRAVRELVCKRADAAFDPAGKSDAYIEARFDMALETAAKGSHAQRVLGGLGGFRADAAPAIPSALDNVLAIVAPAKK